MINDKLLLLGVAAISAVATAGWLRPTPAMQIPQAANFVAPANVLEPVSAPVQLARNTISRNTRRAANAYDDRRYVYEDRRVAQPRSTAKSAAIIAGSAGAGAAVGGLAGGGKGAAIGAVTGGAGGLVYDRMTRNGEDRRDRTGNGRSTAKSAMIIGAGAAAGAAIGGAAGGGKGAAIGALGGGAAGLIYDRMTRNK